MTQSNMKGYCKDGKLSVNKMCSLHLLNFVLIAFLGQVLAQIFPHTSKVAQHTSTPQSFPVANWMNGHGGHGGHGHGHSSGHGSHVIDTVHIKEVWASNLEEEMAHIRNIVDTYNYVAMVCGCDFFHLLFLLCFIFYYCGAPSHFVLTRPTCRTLSFLG